MSSNFWSEPVESSLVDEGAVQVDTTREGVVLSVDQGDVGWATRIGPVEARQVAANLMYAADAWEAAIG